jgi:outer membrane protein OmpA-like peptidoglycan-associated protein
VEIAGHTDSLGDPQQNRQISQQRAEAVKKFLVDHGILGERLRAQGYGAAQPIAGNDTPDGRAKNRRVEFNPIPHR